MKIATSKLAYGMSRPLFNFMCERYKIFLNRQDKKPKPWTKDHILQTEFFCNVFREDDKVTRWVAKHIRRKFEDDKRLPFYLCVARHFNWPDTLRLLLDSGAMGTTQGWQPAVARKVLKQARKDGQKLYTAAYLVSTAGNSMDKVDYSIDKVLTPLSRDATCTWAYRESLRSAHKSLSRYYGFAGFMAYEVVTDLRHTRWLRNATDIMGWANAGPGAKRGLNRVYGRQFDAHLGQELALAEMRELLRHAEHHWPAFYPNLEMREIEHSLCEFDKYERVRLGQGRSKRRYDGAGQGELL